MRSILNNKKAQDMSVTTIIIIILAIVVLVFLIFSFSRSGGNLMDNIKNFFGGGSNVDTVVRSCQAACSTNAVYEYCGKVRDVNVDSKTAYKGSCATLSKSISSLGIEGCSSIDCSQNPLDICDQETFWKTKCSSTDSDKTSSVQNAGTHNLKTEKCCVPSATNAATGTCSIKRASCVGLSQTDCAANNKLCKSGTDTVTNGFRCEDTDVVCTGLSNSDCLANPIMCRWS